MAEQKRKQEPASREAKPVSRSKASGPSIPDEQSPEQISEAERRVRDAQKDPNDFRKNVVVGDLVLDDGLGISVKTEKGRMHFHFEGMRGVHALAEQAAALERYLEGVLIEAPGIPRELISDDERKELADLRERAGHEFDQQDAASVRANVEHKERTAQ